MNVKLVQPTLNLFTTIYINLFMNKFNVSINIKLIQPALNLSLANLAVVLVVYSEWESLFELAFRKSASGSLVVVDLVVDAFFAADIVLTFFVAYLDKSTYLLVANHDKIATSYVTRRFTMDVASTLPFQFIYRILTGKMQNGDVFGFLNLLHL
ncbi:hypothetical protein Ddye_007682 [Dipteronia dyeriana]|uniref:Ion transport domain-containing protein n=1 Tax=Dipteronia dyeriana TaxID=168575 RepID=A0AAE0CRW9_9ROSI|nr:hypothetical protein Ddye_007682 [Dipteronia dyeriana]